MKKLFNSRLTLTKRKRLRNNMPLAETILWSKLKNKQLNDMKFRRQHSIGKYIVDFYCPNRNLIIEIDGDSHYDSHENRIYDKLRSRYFESLGLIEIRFTNKDIYSNIDGVTEKIATTPAPPCK